MLECTIKLQKNCEQINLEQKRKEKEKERRKISKEISELEDTDEERIFPSAFSVSLCANIIKSNHRSCVCHFVVVWPFQRIRHKKVWSYRRIIVS